MVPIGDAQRVRFDASYPYSPRAAAAWAEIQPRSNNVSLDLGMILMPFPENVTVDTSMVDRPLVAWTTAANNPADFLIAGVRMDNGVAWLMFSPNTVTELQVPALPDDFAMLRPTVDTLYFDVIAEYVESSAINSLAAT